MEKSIRKELIGNSYILVLYACIFVIGIFFVYMGAAWRNDNLLEEYRQINELVLMNDERKTSFKLYCKSHEDSLLERYYEDCDILNERLEELSDKMQFDNNCKMAYRLVCQVVEHSKEVAEQYTNPYGTKNPGLINYLDEVDLELERCINQLINHYLEYLNQNFEDSNEQFIIILIVINVSMIVFCYMIIKRNRRFSDEIIHSIEHLSKAATEITNANFEAEDIEELDFDELNQVAGTFDQMKHTIRGMIDEIKEKHQMKELLAEAKIRELQMQMNPHFLFNTLSLVVRNIQLGEKETSIQLIQSISRILRTSIEIKSMAISIDDEIDLLEAYLYIQKLHLRNRVAFSLDVRKSFSNEEFKIPPFTIQPLVENSVKHGLKDQLKNGKVNIVITEKPEYMEVVVADNGVGFPEGKESVKSESGETTGIPKTSIGLNNVRERLKLYYRKDDVMKIERIDGITKVTLKLYRTRDI